MFKCVMYEGQATQCKFHRSDGMCMRKCIEVNALARPECSGFSDRNVACAICNTKEAEKDYTFFQIVDDGQNVLCVHCHTIYNALVSGVCDTGKGDVP